MLQKLFKISGSIYMRVLFGVLLVAFVIFGIGDVFRAHVTGGDVAIVGDEHITPDQVNKQMEQNVRQFGGRIDIATLKRMGYVDHVVDAMIDSTLMSMAAHDEGLIVGDRQAIEEIQKIPVFQDETTHQLDKDRFQRVLAANQINETDFVHYLKQQTATKLLVDTELGPVPVPPSLVDASYKYQAETRRGQILRIKNDAMNVPAPTDDQLTAYYHAHEADFTAPEYRDFSYLNVNLDSFADKATVTPDELKQSYDARQADLKVPERRSLSQIMLHDEAQAKAVYEASKDGKTLTAAGKSAGVSQPPTDLGLMSKQDLPDMLQAPVFEATAGTVLAPVQTPLGWDVIMVQRIEPARMLSFDEAKTSLESDLKAEKSRDALAIAAKQIDDQLAGGASLAEAGKPFGLTPIAVKGVDARGKHPDGSLATELKGHPEVLKTAFETEKDAPAQIKQDGKDAAYAVTVEAITPPVLRPFDEIKAKIVEAYTAEAKAKAAKDEAMALIEKSKSGATFESLAKEASASLVSIGPVLRTTKDKTIPIQALAVLFALTRAGDVGQASTSAGPILVKLEEIIPPAPLSPDDRAALEKTLQSQMQNDIVMQYEKALREIYPVKIDQAAVDRMRATN